MHRSEKNGNDAIVPYIFYYFTNLIIIAITNAKIHSASAKAIARIIVDLMSFDAEGFLPIAVKAAKPINQIAIAGAIAHKPKAIAIAISCKFIIIYLKSKKEIFKMNLKFSTSYFLTCRERIFSFPTIPNFNGVLLLLA